MPIASCIDALYEAIAQFSRSWHRDVNVLKEVNIVEIDEDCVKTVQEHIISKLTGEGRGAVVRHSDPGSREQEDIGDRRHKTELSDARDYQTRNDDPTAFNHVDGNARATSTGLSDRRNEQEVDELFAANENRFTHEGTQTSILPSNITTYQRDFRRSGSTEMGRDDLSRFGMHRFSSLPNLPPRPADDFTTDLPANYKYRVGSTEGSRTTPLSTHNDLGIGGHSKESSRILLPKYERVQNDVGQRGYDLHASSGHPPPYQTNVDDPALLGATGGVGTTSNESLIQTILNQHESGHQTPEETQKLLDRLLASNDPVPKERGHRSRRTQSLDRATRKSKGKDQDGGYDLHSDSRVKRRDDDDEEVRKCSVCFSRRDLTVRKDCYHKLCRSCHRIGLYKGPCSFCKSSKSKTPRSSDERGRSKTKKVPLPDSKTLNPLHGHKDFHVAHGSSSTT